MSVSCDWRISVWFVSTFRGLLVVIEPVIDRLRVIYTVITD